MMELVKKKFKLIVAFAILAVVVIVVVSRSTDTSSGQTKTPTSTAQVDSVSINKSFTFNAINAAKQERPITFTLVSAEKKSEIKVQNDTKTSVPGKDFLLLRIEIENPDTEKLAITSADLVRLVDGGKHFAPDYHNATVILDPISVRKDLVAFVVDAAKNKFMFSIGELTKDKQDFEINFK